MTHEELAAINAPVSLALVESDPVFPDELATACREALEKNGVEHEIKTYAGVPHGMPFTDNIPVLLLLTTVLGFPVLGDYEDLKITSEQQTAYGQMLGWLQAH